ncbi:Polysialic acid transport protein KpsM [Paenibacillus konkukensis]|uniref:Transport permease protein n=1 Tax=Paenibacillus konkukensis TaxID=2020716 RepID=A0ABY4RPM9_9BACL|nr:ABC transporter permease [Paenibacillus konkukensis]UQZ83960.1 Polysialic acid transport protein KpsM [Paenibacillus konkukensis]
MIRRISELYSYRQMLKSLVLTDLRTRYKGSVMGFLWTFLNPLLLLAIYSVVFSFIMRQNIENYPMFLFCAILPWTFFSSCIQSCSGIILRNSNLVKKIYFPREILPLSVIIAGVINYFFGLVILIPSLLLTGIHINISLVAFPLILFVQTLLVLGISLIVSAMNVYFRDLEHIIAIVLQAAFYITPIIFPISMVPKEFQFYFLLNPMTEIIQAYRNIFYYGVMPDFSHLFLYLLYSLIVLVIGWAIFNKLQKSFAEEI